MELAEPREVHHFCCLAGYGAEAINPYLAFETLVATRKHELPQKLDDKEIIKRYIKSIDKGLLKVMSKMGISTYQSYCGAQIFDAVGLKSDFVAKYFTGTGDADRRRGPCGDRRRGGAAPLRCVSAMRRSIARCWTSAANMRSVFAARNTCGMLRQSSALQHAVRGNSYENYRQFARVVSTINRSICIRSADCSASSRPRRTDANPFRSRRSSRRRTSSGASRRARCFGSISREAHDTRHRHEPDRRQIQYRRRRRGTGAFKPLPNGESSARRSSR